MTTPSAFRRVYVANRGEIAVRVIRALHERGIEAVVGFSEADRNAPFVKQADQALFLGPARASESYLVIDKVVAAARDSGCQAVHPGYGFLSERPGFARALEEAGLVFLGPSASVMESLGDKVKARETAQAAGIPVVPGTAKPVTPEQALEAAKDVGFPLLVKAAAGGGGKGMRLVKDAGALSEAVRTASREAAAAFGDGTVFLERYLSRPRHVEVQVLADGHGNVIHAFERECSVQRRHQKVVEESPAPISQDLRDRMGMSAVGLCQTVGYQGAGTVEFLVAGEEYFFLEMNTRIQVEHPVTEFVTGLDLVGWQIDVAAGARLDFRQEDLVQRGHSIEARLYAEDPAQGFLPQPGKLLELILPDGPGIRVDSGVVAGDTVTEFYDPMIAKIVAFGATREAARKRLVLALRETVVMGVRTNLGYLLEILEHEDFFLERTHVHWLESTFPDWKGRHRGLEAALAAVTFADDYATRPGASGSGSSGAARAGVQSPWETLGGFR